MLANYLTGCCFNVPKAVPKTMFAKEFLTKREAAAVVVEFRKLAGETLKACSYDPVMWELLGLKEGPAPDHGWMKDENAVPRSKEIAKGVLVAPFFPVAKATKTSKKNTITKSELVVRVQAANLINESIDSAVTGKDNEVDKNEIEETRLNDGNGAEK